MMSRRIFAENPEMKGLISGHGKQGISELSPGISFIFQAAEKNHIARPISQTDFVVQGLENKG